MQLNQSNTEVLTIISQNPAGISSRDIFNSLVEQYKDSAITIPDDVSKVVYSLRGKHFITTDDTRKKNVHKITKTGSETLKADSNERFELVIAADIASDEAATESALPTPTTKPFFDVSTAVASLKHAGFTILDPLDDLHSPFITIINAMEAASIHPGITRKEQKIDTLKRLGALMSDDIKSIFDNIAEDLFNLEAIAE